MERAHVEQLAVSNSISSPPTATVDHRSPARPLARRQPSAPGRADVGQLLMTCSRPSIDRTRLESFIRTEFFEHFGARITSFMPVLVGLRNEQGKVLAAAGCRSAADEHLFLETYTRVPVEQAIYQRLGVEVSREEIVEVGSLACRSGRVALAMVQALVPYLLEAGFSWVVFTGADTVVRVFRHLHLAPQELCAADKSLLDADQQKVWGSYYDHDPRVMAGRLLEGIRTLGRELKA